MPFKVAAGPAPAVARVRESLMNQDQPSTLAAIRYTRGFAIDIFLLGICDELRLRGLSIGGILQSSLGPHDQCAQSVLVTDLRSGQAFNIWDDRGTGARGCRLDENGLFNAEPAIMGAISGGADIIVINRFGRAESLGRGLLGCFTAAVQAGVPLLTAVRPPYEEAWQRFHNGFGYELAHDPQGVLNWALFSAERRVEGDVVAEL